MSGRLSGKACVITGAGGSMGLQPCHLDDPADCQSLIELARSSG
jgi:FlaA1/EpsC-like NDP-sugar epimerase